MSSFLNADNHYEIYSTEWIESPWWSPKLSTLFISRSLVDHSSFWLKTKLWSFPHGKIHLMLYALSLLSFNWTLTFLRFIEYVTLTWSSLKEVRFNWTQSKLQEDFTRPIECSLITLHFALQVLKPLSETSSALLKAKPRCGNAL